MSILGSSRSAPVVSRKRSIYLPRRRTSRLVIRTRGAAARELCGELGRLIRHGTSAGFVVQNFSVAGADQSRRAHRIAWGKPSARRSTRKSTRSTSCLVSRRAQSAAGRRGHDFGSSSTSRLISATTSSPRRVLRWLRSSPAKQDRSSTPAPLWRSRRCCSGSAVRPGLRMAFAPPSPAALMDARGASAGQTPALGMPDGGG